MFVVLVPDVEQEVSATELTLETEVPVDMRSSQDMRSVATDWRASDIAFSAAGARAGRLMECLDKTLLTDSVSSPFDVAALFRDECPELRDNVFEDIVERRRSMSSSRVFLGADRSIIDLDRPEPDEEGAVRWRDRALSVDFRPALDEGDIPFGEPVSEPDRSTSANCTVGRAFWSDFKADLRGTPLITLPVVETMIESSFFFVK